MLLPLSLLLPSRAVLVAAAAVAHNAHQHSHRTAAARFADARPWLPKTISSLCLLCHLSRVRRHYLTTTKMHATRVDQDDDDDDDDD